MKIRTRLLLAIGLTAAVSFALLGRSLRDDVKTWYFRILEDDLNETANLLAAGLQSIPRETGTPFLPYWGRAIDAAMQRKLEASIYGLGKTKIDLRVYLTDLTGKVIYDSAKLALGHDYSQWNDVYRTLRGAYGARSSRDDPRFPGVSIKYVAAPVYAAGKIAGVLTVAKPAISLEELISATRSKIAYTLLVFFAGFLLISVAVTVWITRPLDLLVRHIRRLRKKVPSTMPPLGRSELGELGREFELLRAELDGRRYVETFVEMLTHEFKTPVAGILGAAEILEGDLAAPDRQKFLGNIQREARRIETITGNLLQISRLENTEALPHSERIDLSELLQDLAAGFRDAFALREVNLVTRITPHLQVSGNAFLLFQAISNLLQNALDFSPAGGNVILSATTGNGILTVQIDDEGPGIPAYAHDKIFTKFYSLERPTTGRKSTGLGLALSRLIIALHGATLTVANGENRGARAMVLWQNL